MKKAVILLVFIALFLLGAYFGLRQYEKQTIIARCETRQTETGIFLEALRTKDSTRCTQLTTPLHERCKAYIADDSSLCPAQDLDCAAIAAHDTTRCAEPLCSAMASGNETYCDNLGENADWCKQMVRLEAPTINLNTCQEIAEQIN